MSGPTDRVLSRLSALGFTCRPGGIEPFGEEVPLVSGVAWDVATAQLVLVAESDDPVDPDSWTQLLFAGSGIRHHLGGDHGTAFGTPVILAIVSSAGKRGLRALAEDLGKSYVLFNRVDLNLIDVNDVEDADRLDDALAPLLPRCREMLGQEIAKSEVQEFWRLLRAEVMSAAEGLEATFAPYRESAGTSCADALIGDDAESPPLPAPTPVSELTLRNFRSVRELDVKFPHVAVIHGPNGGGKSTIIEGLEISWAGTSQRKPDEVSASEYERHLPRDGVGEFSVSTRFSRATGLTDQASAELGRSVLTQDAVASLVNQSPEDRYDALLAATGLEVPDLNQRTADLVDATKRAADAALARASLPTLPRRDSRGLRHLQQTLKSSFAAQLPPIHDVTGAESALASAAEGMYELRSWPSDQEAAVDLINADNAVADLFRSAPDYVEIPKALDRAVDSVGELIALREHAIEGLQPLLTALEDASRSGPRPVRDPPPSKPRLDALPPELAMRWSAHGRALRDAAAAFSADAEAISDSAWHDRLKSYAEALEAVAGLVPQRELASLTAPNEKVTLDRFRELPGVRVFKAAGFSGVPSAPRALALPIANLLATLRAQVNALRTLVSELEGHPSRDFGQHAPTVLDTLCRFELARNLRREGPILRAGEAMVSRLLQGRLAPVVRELVAAVVRFEWHFRPLLVPDEGRRVVFGGLATSQADLDARLLLNSAERTVVGLAWFLALHMLQPEARRQVLVLDDPTSAFDPTNQAGFVSTLRAFVRLTRPGQVVVATHDAAAAATLADELLPVDAWPASVAQLECQRDADDCTTISYESWTTEAQSLGPEIERLGLSGSSELRS